MLPLQNVSINEMLSRQSVWYKMLLYFICMFSERHCEIRECF